MARKILIRVPWCRYCGIALALLAVGCAALKPPPAKEPHTQPRPAPQAHPQPVPQPQRLPEPSAQPQPESHVKPSIPCYAKRFPDFVAVIAQPGDTLSSLASTYLNDPSMDWFISEFNDANSLTPGQEVIIPLQAYEKGGLSLKGYQTVPVICYHRFSKDKADMLTVRESAFEEQMRYLRENGYRVITMDEFFDFLDFEDQIPEKSVVITIDEDWRSAYKIAFPILKKYGYPATLFLYTDFVRDKTSDWDLVAEMSGNGIDMQSHTKTHRNLIGRNGNESFREYCEAVKKELAESAETIRQHLNKDVKYLAYPYGNYNRLTVALLEKLGYRGAFTVRRGSNPFFVHKYRINRSMVFGTFDLQDFKRILICSDSKALQ
jgi:peptidoglycan/xylan/chitin deacetylase (PgdA/CDA1 family)